MEVKETRGRAAKTKSPTLKTEGRSVNWRGQEEQRDLPRNVIPAKAGIQRLPIGAGLTASRPYRFFGVIRLSQIRGWLVEVA